jgi:hypothetical protein
MRQRAMRVCSDARSHRRDQTAFQWSFREDRKNDR